MKIGDGVMLSSYVTWTQVFAAAALHPFKKACGIEVRLPVTLHTSPMVATSEMRKGNGLQGGMRGWYCVLDHGDRF